MARKKRPAQFRIPKSGCVEVVTPKRAFAAKFGFRWVKAGSSRVLIGCPKGKAKDRARGRMVCEVGTKAHLILRPLGKRKACPVGQKRK